MKYKLFCISLVLSFLIPSQIYKQIKILHVDSDDIALFQTSGIDIDHANYQHGQFIEFAISLDDISTLDNLGYDYDVIHEDLQRFYESRLTENYTREFGLGSMGGYYTLEEAIQRLDDIHEEYPDFVSEKISLGQSFEGRDIYAIKVSANVDIDEDEPEILYTGMHHAREPMSFMNLYYFIYWILENYSIDDTAAQILDTRELWFIPIVNPDGYEYNRSIAPNGGGMQRKNMRNTCNGSADGIDPNRNYDYMWGLDNQGSSPDGCSETYRGTSAFSEPETQAVRDFIEGKNFTIAMNYHSYSNLLIYPFGYSYENPMDPDDLNTFIEYAQDMTQYNNYLLGTGIETVGYTVNGEACDWMYGVHGVYAYTPEVGNNSDGFWPSTNRIIPLCEENLYANQYLALVAGSSYNSDIGFGFRAVSGEVVAYSHSNEISKNSLKQSSDNLKSTLKSVKGTYNHSINKSRHLWWKLRPHTAFSTIEFRMCDVQRRFKNIEMLASLAQALCYVALNEHRDGRLVESFNIELLNDSLWKAIRYGSESYIYDEVSDERYTMEEFVRVMLDYSTPGLKFFKSTQLII
mgnify:CR=1 FL=1